MPLFLDDMDYTAFARRLAWSPDGTFLLTPGSQYIAEKQESVIGESTPHVCYGFLKAQINKPAFVLPGMDDTVTAIRFHPRLFARRAPKTDDD